MSGYKKPLPVSSPESRSFWEGCRRHELLVQRCAECRAFWFPPSILCPECLGTAWEWTKISGWGRVYSFVVFHRVYHVGFTDEIPYVVAVVELEEGPRLMSNIIGCDPYDVHCEMAVEVVFEDISETVTLPKFRPRKNFHWR
jgi:uncharacterized OB-fold protein